MGEIGVLDCMATLEYKDKSHSTTGGKAVFKTALLKLIRNEHREMYLQINGGKRDIRYALERIKVGQKFMSEGKASITFQQPLCTLFISNAPPSQLFGFLKLMMVKLVKDDGKTPAQHIRTKMLSTKPQATEEISPLTDKEIEKARVKAMGADNKTPTGVRKAEKRPSLVGLDVKAKKRCVMMEEPKQPVMEGKEKKNSLLKIAELKLCGEQLKVLQAAKGGRSMFFTGSAGSGKSLVLKSVIAALPPDVTFATASTGVAACHIGGTTLHQFAGIGTGQGTLEQCINLASRPNHKAVWRRCKHLIIDEISMVSAEFFDKLEHVARIVRNNDRPFGGIQLILCGDFFQLPPVSKDAKFCFQAESWENCIDCSYELQTVHRQSDPVLIDMLQNIRIGHVTSEIIDRLQATSTQSIEKDGILATRLCTHTADAAAVNAEKLAALSGEKKIFTAMDSPEGMASIIDKQSPVLQRIVLKVGCQVMLMKNLNVAKGLVNGARGVVVKFEKDGLPVVKFHEVTSKLQQEKFLTKTAFGSVLTRVQLPLNLAWAFSIHKSQGLTLDCVEMSLGKVFAAGHAYVALSRVKSLDSLRVIDLSASHIWANKDVLMFYQKFRRKMKQMQLVPLGAKFHKPAMF